MMPLLVVIMMLAIAFLTYALRNAFRENRELRETIECRNDRIEQLIADKVKS